MRAHRVAAALVALTLALAACGSSTDSGGSTTTTAGTTAAGTPSPSPASSGPAAGSSGAASASLPSTSAPTGGAAAAYCTEKGGEVQGRTAAWGTNGDPTTWLTLVGQTDMCRFQADDEAKSRIYVDLVTLSSTEPTLAGLAYLSKVPSTATPSEGNPATVDCGKLGGSSTFGSVGASGGGWVNKSDPADEIVGLCVFPDLSFIDEWGIAYYSGGVVRGIDLATVMAYQPSGPPPAVFHAG